jgi:hypothetical protein
MSAYCLSTVAKFVSRVAFGGADKFIGRYLLAGHTERGFYPARGCGVKQGVNVDHYECCDVKYGMEFGYDGWPVVYVVNGQRIVPVVIVHAQDCPLRMEYERVKTEGN